MEDKHLPPSGNQHLTLKEVANLLVNVSKQEDGNYARILKRCAELDVQTSFNHSLLALAASSTYEEEELFELLSKGEAHAEKYLSQKAQQVCKKHGIEILALQKRWCGSLEEILKHVVTQETVEKINTAEAAVDLLERAAAEMKTEIIVTDDAHGCCKTVTPKISTETKLHLIRYKNGLYSIVKPTTEANAQSNVATTDTSLLSSPPQSSATTTGPDPAPMRSTCPSVSVTFEVPYERIDVSGFQEPFEDKQPVDITNEGDAITVVIKCTHTAQKLIASRFASADILALSLTKSIQYMQKLGENGRLDRMFGTITLNDEEEQGIRILPDVFQYEMLDASEIEVFFKDSNGAFISGNKEDSDSLFHLKLFHICKVEFHVSKLPLRKPSFNAGLEKITPKEKKLGLIRLTKWFDARVSKIRRFINFLCFCSNLQFSFSTNAQVGNVIRRAGYEMIGVIDHVRTMLSCFQFLASPNHKLTPQSTIFCGPPGNGKSTMIRKLIDEWNLFQVCRPLTAGDFRQKFVGDAEKMVLAIASRAAVIPWELTLLHIDKIEELSLNVLGSIFSMIRDTRNLLLFNSTNYIHDVDPSLLKRTTGYIRFGYPSYDDRLEWLTSSPHIDALKFNCDVEHIAEMTVNFSHHAMARLITCLSTLDASGTPLSIETVRSQVILVSKELGISVGRYNLAELLKETNQSSVDTFLCKLESISSRQGAPSKKIFVNLNKPTELVREEHLTRPSTIDYNIQKSVYSALSLHLWERDGEHIISLGNKCLENEIKSYDGSFLSRVLNIPSDSHMTDSDLFELLKMMVPSVSTSLDQYFSLRTYLHCNKLSQLLLKSLAEIRKLKLDIGSIEQMEEMLKQVGFQQDLGPHKSFILQMCVNAHKTEQGRQFAFNLIHTVILELRGQVKALYDTIIQALKENYRLLHKVEFLTSNEAVSPKTALQALVKIAHKEKMSIIRLVDGVSMAQGEYKKLIRDEVYNVRRECEDYPNYMVIFDLDGIHGNSSSTTLLRSSTLEQIMRNFENCNTNNMWLVAISSNNHIIKLFSERLG